MATIAPAPLVGLELCVISVREARLIRGERLVFYLSDILVIESYLFQHLLTGILQVKIHIAHVILFEPHPVLELSRFCACMKLKLKLKKLYSAINFIMFIIKHDFYNIITYRHIYAY